MSKGLQGPRFPSFTDPPRSRGPQVKANRALPPGKSWLAHTGRRARLKNLRNACQPVLKDKNPETVAAVARLREATKDEPEPEYGFLHLLFHAKTACDDTGASIHESITYLLDNWTKTALPAVELARDIGLEKAQGSPKSKAD